MAREILQYDTRHDQHETDHNFIKTQLETHLKERFNVLISTIEYEIVDGHLVRPGKREPFINSIRRGRNLLRSFGSTPEDFAREDAEARGFEEFIDPVFSDPETPTDAIILSPSLNGRLDSNGKPITNSESKYMHNFHDIFTLKQDDKGQRYVELRRYSSGLTGREYAERLPGLDPESPPTPAEFLANPVVMMDTRVTADDIHRLLHEDHEYMDVKDFNEIWDAVQPFVLRYLANKDARSFNAILNFADEVWENRKRREEGQKYRDYFSGFYPSRLEINYFENQEVRQVATACPGKSGAGTDSPYSVSEFADMDYDFDQLGPCKTCGADINCGPCGICKSCDLKIRREERFKIAA